jgi:hypothetical protein
MQIKILGAGGAINDGIPYNAFAIDSRVLCEAPPDIMVSLKRRGIDCTKITTIFVSHFHADHCFGMPFFLLNRFNAEHDREGKTRLTIAGPRGIKKTTLALLAKAFGNKHPCVPWTRISCRFIELTASSRFELILGCRTLYFRMRHMVETYGFIMFRGRKPLFAYTADTLWCGSVERILKHRPMVALMDLNGARDDRVPVHISPDDVIEFGMPMTRTATTYYGTHLRRHKTSSMSRLIYARPGMVIAIP